MGLGARGVSDAMMVDLEQSRLDRAKELGAGAAVPSGSLEASAQRFDLVVDRTGGPAVCEAMPAHAADGATLLFFGVCAPGAKVGLSPLEIFRRELTLVGSHSLSDNIPDARPRRGPPGRCGKDVEAFDPDLAAGARDCLPRRGDHHGRHGKLSRERAATPRRLSFVVAPAFGLLDLSGPTCAFNFAREFHGAPHEVTVASSAGGPDAHLLGCQPATTGLLGSLAPATQRMASICTGAFYLAEAGILDGHCATTRWHRAPLQQSRFPSVSVDADRIYAHDREVWASAGIAAGIDMALALVEADFGTGTVQVGRPRPRGLPPPARRAVAVLRHPRPGTRVGPDTGRAGLYARTPERDPSIRVPGGGCAHRRPAVLARFPEGNRRNPGTGG